jgi:LCP family protein required for cell wall assembly
MGSRNLARAGYSLSCLLAAIVLAASGFSYFVVRDVSAIGGSHAIASGPSIGPQNILLMGLESRRDWNGNILPNHILHELHAGSAQGVANGVGGNATNTLILIHIPAGGKKAVGFSIPRDDWVNFAGTVGPQQQGKIDQAYGVSMYYEQAKLKQQNPNISQNALAFQGNEAGRTAAVATVEKLAGVHIDHFAEVNLDGFYELANVLGGVEVCLNHATSDSNSGFVGQKGYQHLDAAQALAFVRQRDNLPNGDLDRTHRQQAFLDSVMHQLRTEGVLSDLSKMQALLNVGKQYVITDSGWNLLDFATQMRSRRQHGVPHAADQGLRHHRRAVRQPDRSGLPPVPGSGDVLPEAGHAQRSAGADHRPDRHPAADDGRCPQRRQHGRARRAGLGRAHRGRVPGREDRQHGLPDQHDGALRHRRVGKREQDRHHVRHHGRGQHFAGRWPCRGAAR